VAAASPARPNAAAGLWEDCRNSLGIARLLVNERRPEALVDTACRMAMETACRAALEHTGALWPGDIDAALRHLHVRRASDGSTPSPRARLLEAEETVALVAAWLRRQDPGRSWGF
jgi:hypothetical protein